MAVNRKKLVETTKSATVAYGGDTLNIKYRPHVYTPAFEQKLRAMRDEDKPTEAYRDHFRAAIAWWDLEDEFPTSEGMFVTRTVNFMDDAEFGDTPWTILSDVFTAIGKANTVGELIAETYESTW